MVLIEPSLTWAKVEQRLASEVDPVLRRNLEVVLAHMKAEAVGDMDGLLATMSDRGTAYHTYDMPDVRELNPVGKGEVRMFYENFIASGATRLQFDVDRLVVDRDCVVTEGMMRMAYPGRTLVQRGIPVDDPEAYYLFETRMCTLWPFGDDGLALGEDTYTGLNGFDGIGARKLTSGDIGELPSS